MNGNSRQHVPCVKEVFHDTWSTLWTDGNDIVNPTLQSLSDDHDKTTTTTSTIHDSSTVSSSNTCSPAKQKRNKSSRCLTKKQVKDTHDTVHSEHQNRPYTFQSFCFQTQHIDKLLSILKRNHVALDASQTGCGKTMCSIKIAQALNYQLFIVCPKPAITTWIRELSRMDMLPHVMTVTNYDILRNGKWYDFQHLLKNQGDGDLCDQLQSSVCPHIYKKWRTENTRSGRTVRRVYYVWNLPPRTLVIVDEAHKGKNKVTQNARILIGLREHVFQYNHLTRPSLRSMELWNRLHDQYREYQNSNPNINQNNKQDGRCASKTPLQTTHPNVNNLTDKQKQQHPYRYAHVLLQFLSVMNLHFYTGPETGDNEKRILLLTATSIEKSKNVSFLLYLLGYMPDPYPTTFRQLGKDITRNLALVHHVLFESEFATASRMTLEQARKEKLSLHGESHMVECTLETKIITMSEEKRVQIQKQNILIQKALKALAEQRKMDSQHPLTVILRARQEIESLKMDDFIRVTREKLKEGYSVIVYLNFCQSVAIMENEFASQGIKTAKIVGNQTIVQQKKAEEDFQSNRVKLLLVNISAGSASISLDDVTGKHPRFGLISTPWSATDFRQAMGRADRITTKSNVLYWVLYCANTIEEKMAKWLREKLNQMDMINTGRPSKSLIQCMMEEEKDDDLCKNN